MCAKKVIPASQSPSKSNTDLGQRDGLFLEEGIFLTDWIVEKDATWEVLSDKNPIYRVHDGLSFPLTESSLWYGEEAFVAFATLHKQSLSI